MTSVSLQGVRKIYGRTAAVDGVDLDIHAGDLFFLLGPSGCGKTTLLRAVAGFVEPTAGRIRFDDRDVTRLPPNKRRTGMVFQSYALWPHMSVRQNVAFGLDVRRVGREERERRVERALARVRMLPQADRKPNQLSGGQQQRVALARALVIEPSVLLLDEPLSNLDAKLRLEMREQIRDICRDTGITTIYVTHDQKEALSMADRVAVMRDGRVVQVGTPRELYDRPATRFVADFLGETNFLPGQVVEANNGSVVLDTPAGLLRSNAFDHTVPRGGNVTCSIRPEAIRFLASPSGENGIRGRRVSSVFLGEIGQHAVEVGGDTVLRVLELNPAPRATGEEEVFLRVDPEDVVLLPD